MFLKKMLCAIKQIYKHSALHIEEVEIHLPRHPSVMEDDECGRDCQCLAIICVLFCML